MSALHFKIVTPDRVVLEADVVDMVVPGALGQMEVLDQHAAMITSLSPGELQYRLVGGEMQSLFVGQGFLEVENNNVILVTDVALEASDIDEHSVEDAVQAAVKALKDVERLSAEERARLDADLAKQIAILEYNRKHRR